MAADDSLFIIYGAPLVGILLLTVGISAGVMGAYSVVQQELDLCGDPIIEVKTEEGTAAYTGPDQPSLQRISVDELTPAERKAFYDAFENPRHEGKIRGEATHLDAFQEGVLVSYEDGERYVTLDTYNECVNAGPQLFPLGLVFILLGFGGIFTPPMFRRLEAFESKRRD